MWCALVKVTFVHPGNRQCRSRRMISRRCVAVGKRRARPSYIVCPTSSSRATTMVASQAMRRTVSPLINSPLLELTGQLRGLVDQCGQRSMDHDGMRAGRSLGRRADGLQEGVAEPLVPSGLTIRGHLPGPGLEGRTDLGVGLGRELGRHGVEGVVEADRAHLVVRLRRGARGPLEGPTELPELVHRALPGALAQLSVRLGRRRVHHRPDLVEAELSLGQTRRQMRKVEEPFTDVRPGSCRGHGDTAALDDPCLERGGAFGAPPWRRSSSPVSRTMRPALEARRRDVSAASSMISSVDIVATLCRGRPSEGNGPRRATLSRTTAG